MPEGQEYVTTRSNGQRKKEDACQTSCFFDLCFKFDEVGLMMQRVFATAINTSFN